MGLTPVPWVDQGPYYEVWDGRMCVTPRRKRGETVRDIQVSSRLRVRPLPGVTVTKVPGLREWLFQIAGKSGRNCLLDPETIQEAATDRLLNLVPEDGFNHGEGVFWEFARPGEDGD